MPPNGPDRARRARDVRFLSIVNERTTSKMMVAPGFDERKKRVRNRVSPARPALLFWAWLVGCWVLPAAALAQQTHTVRAGQSLAKIADRYHVSVRDLAAANGLPRTAALREGRVLVVPERGTVYVEPGDTVSGIARRHHVDPEALARHNRLGPNQALQLGQRLVLPGFEAAEAQQKAEHRWGTPRHPGWVVFQRLRTEEKRRIRVLDSRGRVRPAAIRDLRQLLRPMGSRKRKDPHPRLLRLIAQTVDHFGGRPVQVVSGYRLPGGFTKESSRHAAGQAIDFRISGVPLAELHEYCRRFDHVGVGLYPRSRFVHLDVRKDDARWTDYSGPGQAPVRRAPGSEEVEAESSESADPSSEGEAPLDDGASELSDEAE
jgi:uncharacterized protein YcbK (DUF882 family)